MYLCGYMNLYDYELLVWLYVYLIRAVVNNRAKDYVLRHLSYTLLVWKTWQQ